MRDILLRVLTECHLYLDGERAPWQVAVLAMTLSLEGVLTGVGRTTRGLFFRGGGPEPSV